MRSLPIALAVCAVMILAACEGAPSTGPFATGMKAYQAGDYETALNEWLPLAEAGHADAQHNLGVMYFQAQGVSQDYAASAMWLERAAEQGAKGSAKALSTMYAHGYGVDYDPVQAYKWMRIAVDQGDSDAPAGRDSLAKLLTAEQIGEAEALADAWKPTR